MSVIFKPNYNPNKDLMGLMAGIGALVDAAKAKPTTATLPPPYIQRPLAGPTPPELIRRPGLTIPFGEQPQPIWNNPLTPPPSTASPASQPNAGKPF